MPLNATDIRNAFDALAADLAGSGERAELVIAGGAALVLLFNARETTKDVDAYFLRPGASVVRSAAARVAAGRSLPEDWLNDAAKGFFVGVTNGDVVYQASSLLVRAASVPQLLAMKLAAWRDAIDRADARLLLSKMRGSRAEIWQQVEPLVPLMNVQKASYAFEDLWEAVHGPS
jgi:hypothetical protein